MAWFALSLRPPWSADESSSQHSWVSSTLIKKNSTSITSATTTSTATAAMFGERIHNQVEREMFTVRIFDPSSRPKLLRELRNTVSSCGGIFVAELVERRGFIFSMPPNTPSPWSNYQHGKLLEEGCIQVTREIEKEHVTRACRVERCESVKSSDDEDDDGTGTEEEYVDDHPKLRMQWTWTELKR